MVIRAWPSYIAMHVEAVDLNGVQVPLAAVPATAPCVPQSMQNILSGYLEPYLWSNIF